MAEKAEEVNEEPTIDNGNEEEENDEGGEDEELPAAGRRRKNGAQKRNSQLLDSDDDEEDEAEELPRGGSETAGSEAGSQGGYESGDGDDGDGDAGGPLFDSRCEGQRGSCVVVGGILRVVLVFSAGALPAALSLGFLLGLSSLM